MFIIGCLKMLVILPISWLDAFYIRLKPFHQRYQRMNWWSKRLLHAFGCSVEVENYQDDFQGPTLFISNHQSLLDMSIQMAFLKTPYSYISKIENKKIPYVCNWAKTLELIYFDRSDTLSAVSMLRESARLLKKEHNMFIFPEGTRAKDGKLLPLQAGSLKPAYLAKARIVPIVLHDSYDFKKHLLHHQNFHVSMLDAYEYDAYRKVKAEDLVSEIQQKMEAVLTKTSKS